MKAFFMNEIFGLKMEIKSLKEKLGNRGIKKINKENFFY